MHYFLPDINDYLKISFLKYISPWFVQNLQIVFSVYGSLEISQIVLIFTHTRTRQLIFTQEFKFKPSFQILKANDESNRSFVSELIRYEKFATFYLDFRKCCFCKVKRANYKWYVEIDGKIDFHRSSCRPCAVRQYDEVKGNYHFARNSFLPTELFIELCCACCKLLTIMQRTFPDSQLLH